MNKLLLDALVSVVEENKANLLALGEMALEQTRAKEHQGRSGTTATFTAIVDAFQIILHVDRARPKELVLVNGFALN